MKKIYIIIAIFILLVGVFSFLPVSNIVAKGEYSPDEFLRIHIRANSNNKVDQNVKYKVKEAFVEILTPLLADADTKEKSERIILDNLNMLDLIANQVLSENGFSYTAKTFLRKENFPTRTYDNITLKADVYDAVVVELGAATGDNWWCVIYPPMCFVDGNDGNKNVVYVSKLVEVIKKFLGR